MNVGEWLEKATCAVLIEGQIVGTAWLVSDEGHLLTAGHVLGTEQPVDEVEVQFVGDVPCHATRVEWKYDEDDAIDFAVLKLSVPIKRRHLLVSLVKKVEEGQFWLCGYGTTMKEQSQYRSKGEFLGSMYIEHSSTTYLFRLRSSDLGLKGNSGGAVFSDELQRVVAIQTEASNRRIGPESDVVLAMPLYRVAQFWQPLQMLAEKKLDQSTREHPIIQKRAVSQPSSMHATNAQQRDKPFYFNQPVKPADFMGRWGLVDEVVNDLCCAVPDSWAVIGGRRFGKSSVLKVIESCLFEQLAASARGQRHILPLRVDLDGCEKDTTDMVYACLLRRLHEVLENRSFLAMSKDASHDSHAIGPQSAKSISFYQFENSLKQLTQYFEQHYGPLRLIFLLDEVEAVTRFAWHETLFDQLRYLIYDSNLVEHIRLVLTGSARVIESRQAGSPLLNAVNIKYLDLFSPSDMQQLIARGGQIPDEAAASVQNQSGGHPFIAQYLLSNLWTSQHGLTEASSKQVEKVARKMRRHRNNDMRGWWEAIGQHGQHAYAVLAEHEGWIDEGVLIREFQIQDVDDATNALCYHGIVARHDSQQLQYRVAGELFRQWYLRNAKGKVEIKNNEAQVAPSRDVQEDSTFSTIENHQHMPSNADKQVALSEVSSPKTPNVKSSSKPQEKVRLEVGHERLSFEQRAKLVEHLLAIPSIADNSRRATVIDALPAEIKTNVAYSSVANTYVLNLVNTCLQYPNGMQELRDILQFFENGSIPMQNFNQVLDRLLSKELSFDRSNDQAQLSIKTPPSSPLTMLAQVTPEPITKVEPQLGSKWSYILLIVATIVILLLVAILFTMLFDFVQR